MGEIQEDQAALYNVTSELDFSKVQVDCNKIYSVRVETTIDSKEAKNEQ